MSTTKESIKSALMLMPGGPLLLRVALRASRSYRFRKSVGSHQNSEEVFTKYYLENSWGNEESASGPGSTLEYTENIRRELPRLFEQLQVRTVLDAPCGDYNWFRYVERGDVKYIGGDLVKPLAEKNQERFGDDTTRFMQLDIVKDALPKVDLWLCRDALFHIREADVLKAIGNFLRSDIKYWLTTSHTNCRLNTDIPTGAWREMNLQLPPYGFPEPQEKIADWIEGFPVRYLCLWERESLRKHLAKTVGLERFACGSGV